VNPLKEPIPSLKYSIERLDNLITNSYSPLWIEEQMFAEDELSRLNENIFAEIKNIRSYLRRKACDIENERSFELLVHQYQGIIIDLLDKVFHYEKEAGKVALSLTYQFTLDRLDDLLEFIEKTFSVYFNKDEKIPELHLQSSKRELKEGLPKLQRRFKDKFLDPQIVKISLGPIETIINAESKEINFRKLGYAKELFRQLVNFANSNRLALDEENASNNQALIELLVYMNLNTCKFTSYVFSSIETAINLLTEQVLKIDKLSFDLKGFKQIQERPGYAYKINLASVKEQVITWISEEITYQETRSRLLFKVPSLIDDSKPLESEKLMVSASVDVLALLARAAKDSKFIVNKNMTDMFKSLSRFCRTTKADSPAANSMLKKSYVAERGTKIAATNILHEMIKWVHKY